MTGAKPGFCLFPGTLETCRHVVVESLLDRAGQPREHESRRAERMRRHAPRYSTFLIEFRLIIMSAVSLSNERRSTWRRRPVPPPLLKPTFERPKTDWGTVILVNLVSLLLHAAILGVCGLIVLDHETREEIFTLLTVSPEIENDPIFEQAWIQPDDLKPNQEADNSPITVNRDQRVADTMAAVDLDINDLVPSFVPEDFNVAGPNIKIGDHFSGRSAAVKSAL